MASCFGAPIRRPGQVREGKLLRQSVLQHFQHIRTPEWIEPNIMMEIMTIALFAVLSGADGFVAIETSQQWLESFLQLPYGIHVARYLCTGVCSTGAEGV